MVALTLASKCSGITSASLRGGKKSYMGTHVGFCYYHGNTDIIVLCAYILLFGKHFLGHWWWSITSRVKQEAFNRPTVGGQSGLLGPARSVRMTPCPRHNNPNHSGAFVVKQDKVPEKAMWIVLVRMFLTTHIKRWQLPGKPLWFSIVR